MTAVGVPVTAVGVPASSNVSDEVATAAAVVGIVVGVTGKLQNCMIVVTKVHDSDLGQHLICHSGSRFCSIVSLPIEPWKGCKKRGLFSTFTKVKF
jgi:hypothetical protein